MRVSTPSVRSTDGKLDLEEAAYRELQASKVGRKARLKGTVEQVAHIEHVGSRPSGIGIDQAKQVSVSPEAWDVFVEVARRVEQYRQRNATPEPKSADIGLLLFSDSDYENLANQLRKMMDEGKIPG